MKTRVVNVRTEACEVRIDRGTPWGNPFKVGRDGDRAEVIRKYREHLAAQPELVARARRELQGKVLGCWCKPEACHGDVLVELIDSQTSGADDEGGVNDGESVRAVFAGGERRG